MTIRPALPSDLPSIAALEESCFSLPRRAGELSRSLMNFLVAEDEGRFAGYADCACVIDEGYIGNIAVAPALRRRGIGESLLRALLEWGEARKLAFLTLEVRAQNAPARALYEKLGFETVAVRKNLYEKPTDDAVLMTYYYKR